MNDHEYRALLAANAEARATHARLSGQIEGTIEALRRDPKLLAEVDRVALRRGVEPGVVMDETIERARAMYMPAPLDVATAEPEPASPAVQRFREILA